MNRLFLALLALLAGLVAPAASAEARLCLGAEAQVGTFAAQRGTPRSEAERPREARTQTARQLTGTATQAVRLALDPALPSAPAVRTRIDRARE